MPSSGGVIRDIIAQHVEETSFLWFQRVAAVRSPAFSFRSLTHHDERMAAHIDALRIAGDQAAPACEPLMEASEPGAIFAPAVLALEAKEFDRIETLLALAEAAPAMQTGLMSAFGWISGGFLQGTAKELLAAASPFRRGVAIASCAMHGVPPGQSLGAATTDPDPFLRTRALRAAGELGQHELLMKCADAMSDEQPPCQFWAARSSALLGERSRSVAVLSQGGMTDSPYRLRAFQLALQAMGAAAAHSFLKALSADPQQLRWLLQGSGIAGDPTYVPWLIDHMREEKTARLAGEAFSLITGADLSALNLQRPRPEGFESGPNDNPEDENVDMDADEALPWPEADKVEKWWAANASRFQKGTRYFMGKPVTHEHCIDVLKHGYQRQRILAAHYLCLLDPGTPLFNTSAPAWRQQRLLAKM